jgi:hypothetical protein
VDCGANPVVGAATAKYRRHPLIDLFIGRSRVLLEQRYSGHDLSRLAPSALRHVNLQPGPLNGVRQIFRQALDRQDLALADTLDRDEARVCYLAIQVNGA